jgi:MoaA/NifB/PqqE/SkfB family radical SAM enzyme
MKRQKAQAAGENTVSLPAAAARALGLAAGAKLDVVVRRGKVELLPDIHSLSRIYIEPTSRCNLSCRGCIRQASAEPEGDMSAEVFKALMKGLPRFPHLQSAMFGGFGEPTAHPDILGMIAAVKRAGLFTELVSNGTSLDEALAAGLVKSGLGRLWISIDGTDAHSFEASRSGALFKDLVARVKLLRAADPEGSVALGLAFVVTRENIKSLRNVGDLARELGASRVSVSNPVPYSPETEKLMVCGQAMSLGGLAPAGAGVVIDLPRLDISSATRNTVLRLIAGPESLELMGDPVAAETDHCRFVRERCVFVRWDGKVAPCMALMRDHTVYFRGGSRANKRHVFGALPAESLADIWSAPAYRDFREKVAEFDFSPCHVCGGCSFSDDNAGDCGGSRHPAACGGCLWGQGVIQCP